MDAGGSFQTGGVVGRQGDLSTSAQLCAPSLPEGCHGRDGGVQFTSSGGGWQRVKKANK